MPSIRRGFTLVELVIVVLILGLLAAIIIPKFTNATETSRNTSVMTTLSYLRGQIEVFKSQHANSPPQITGMWTLLQHSSDTAETATANPVGTSYGPYFRSTPLNVWNGLTGVTSANIDTTAGWYYTATSNSYDLRIRDLDGSVNYNY